jgi:hypothetical protein
MNYSLIITIVIAFMQIFIVGIPLSGKLADNRRVWYKRLNSRGWALVGCCSIVAALSVILFNLSEEKDELSEKKLQKQLEKRDLTHQKIVADAALKLLID